MASLNGEYGFTGAKSSGLLDLCTEFIDPELSPLPDSSVTQSFGPAVENSV